MRRSTFISAGVELSVCETGEGPLFVFQHGLCGDAAQPAQVFPDDAGWCCLTMEARGHGGSEAGPVDKLAISTFCQDLSNIIAARGTPKVVVGGISMGAAIALRLAVTRPELVSGLVLARPAWLTDRGPENMKPNAFVGQLIRNHQPDAAREAFESSGTAAQLAAEAPDNLASLWGFFDRKPLATTAELLSKISADGPGVTEAEVARLSVPTLVIGHGRDLIHPIGYAQQLAGWIPGSKFVKITAKADDAEAYRRDFRSALKTFLEELSQ
jgi:pimeloyl-ACP methyl ester carboxylesterase